MGEARTFAAVGRGDRSIPTLDGWRAVAILAVVACHGVPRSSFLWPLRLFGTHGVYVFFGISGFLITSKLLEEERRNGRIDLGAFYLRRAFRILPPALVFLTVVAALGAASVLAPMPAREWISDAFFLQSYVGVFPGRTPYTVHFWSLAVEEHFYLVFPFLLALLGSRRVRALVPWVCGAIALWRIADDLWVHTYARLFPGIFPNYRTDRIADFLLWGCFLALVLQSEPVRRTLQRLLTNTVWTALAFAFVLVLWKQPPLSLTIEAMLIPLLLAGTVLGSASLPAAVLELSPMRALGRISYSLYLWQMLFFIAALREPIWAQEFPFNVVFGLGCALASYQLVEKPLAARGRKLAAAWRKPAFGGPALGEAGIGHAGAASPARSGDGGRAMTIA